MSIHGTGRGYHKHLEMGILPCNACTAANTRASRDYKARDACTPGLGWPVRVTPGVGPAGRVPVKKRKYRAVLTPASGS